METTEPFNLTENIAERQTTASYNITQEREVNQSTNDVNESIIFKFHSISGDKQSSELFVGMKAELSVMVIYPDGIYDEISIKVRQETPFSNFDVLSKSCYHGGAIRSEIDEDAETTSGVNTGFKRFPMLGIVHKFINISESKDENDRQEICNFTVFLHNTFNLNDGDILSITAEVKASTVKRNVFTTKSVEFIARSIIMERNKTASCEIDSGVPHPINTEVLRTNMFKINCWIPLYNPKITFLMSDESEIPYKYIISMFFRLNHFGSNFKRGALRSFMYRACRFSEEQSNDLKYGFPKNWVNRAYYYTTETSNADLLVFEASATLSSFAVLGGNYSLRVGILLDDNLLWNSTVLMTAKRASVDEVIPYSVTLKPDSETGISPSVETAVLLEVTIFKQILQTVVANITTKALSNNSDPGLRIHDVVLSHANDHVACIRLHVINNQNESSDLQTKVRLTFQISSTSDDIHGPSIASFRIELRIHAITQTLADTQIVEVSTDHQTMQSVVPINNPRVLQDKNGTISSQFFKLLDGNYTSCVRVPVNGQYPPLLQMTVNTNWLNISHSAYNITVSGENIPCRHHPQRILKVSYPIGGPGQSSKREHHQNTAFCTLSSESALSDNALVHCTYTCPCKEPEECQELVIFMANQEITSEWKLCELKARNL